MSLGLYNIQKLHGTQLINELQIIMYIGHWHKGIYYVITILKILVLYNNIKST